ncbi:glycerophosphodiester phosphodiesterase family protein [Erythrobacter sp. BLCC-B19]|uniref:glycerophosphodiester phosphodiesterase family protein n=1 Tax=Erythrobacter sp. BLCC-B19 TaxID=3025315 RepID=UPI00235FA29A|nr:glycerophosphodiester phosphodiesterase family protein [Erythrobacter sp. BLCC-B19]WDA40453.1 glycerophosphodiester phosphodiesterase family protein [Erythrobacter sp. BLCC-B19]
MGRMKVLKLALAGMAAMATPLAAQDGGAWRLAPETDLSAMLDCFENAGQTLVSAHRGGPTPGLPENAIPTMEALLMAAPAIMEVDVGQSTDGVLFLLHDDRLDRTTTGTGEAAAQDWAALSALKLKDNWGWVTPYAIPKLSEALAWAKGRTVMQIDFKRSANVDKVVAEIRAAGMAGSVILIAYSVEQAASLHRAAPEMLLSVSVDAPGDVAALKAAGIPEDRMVAFTGTRLPRPELYRELDKQNIEVIFGTLGRPPRSIDAVIDRYGMDERYAELGKEGIDILATDRPREAAAALAEAGRLPKPGQCGVSRAALEEPQEARQ